MSRKRIKGFPVPEGDFEGLDALEAALFRELDRLEEVALPDEDTVDGDQSDSCYWLEQGMNRNRNG